MAKYGEGDKRWIVQERPDGTNVHNWHWSETNCLEWSRNLLSNLLSDLTIMDGEGNLYIKTKKVAKVDGDAYVNIRKGKIIPGYEISVSLSWEGEARDADGKCLLKVTGSIEIPYIADENADEDPEIKVTVKDESPIGKRLKEAVVSKGKPIVWEKVRVYVQSMAKGGPAAPAKEELELEKPPTNKSSSSPASAAAASSSSSQTKKEKSKKGFRSISLTERFHCRPIDLYDIMLNEDSWKWFSQSNAKISREVGGQFSLFDGSITGTNQELQQGKLIVQKWRFGNWADGIHSTVRLEFDESQSGVTTVKLTQTDIPEEDKYGNSTVVENTEKGWRDLIFNKIRALFRFGV